MVRQSGVGTATSAKQDIIIGYIDPEVAEIKAKTDLLPASPMPSTIPAQTYPFTDPFPFTDPASFVGLTKVMTTTGAIAVASDTVLYTNATERTTVSTTAEKLKEMNMDFIQGTIRTYFELRVATAGGTAYGQVYKDGTALGTARSTTSVSYVSFTEDLAFTQNSLYQVYGNAANGYTCYMYNQKINGTLSEKGPRATAGY
jgi:hypothetical protein